MASIRFGNIVTGIKGSIGGTTYREFKNGWIAQQRSSGGDKVKLRANPKLQQLNTAVQLWAAMPLETRDGWQTRSNLYWFKNRWNVNVKLSARNFFIKIANGCLNIGQPIPISADVNDALDFAGLDACTIVPGGAATAQFFTFGLQTYATLHAAILPKGRNYSVLKSGPIIWAGRIDMDLTIDFTTEFFSRYPYAQAGDVYSVTCQPYNYYGWKKTAMSMQIDVIL